MEFKANMGALAGLGGTLDKSKHGPEMTFLLLTMPEKATSETEIQQTPVRCRPDEIPAAFAAIDAGVPVGVLYRTVLQNLIKTIDEFEQANGCQQAGGEESQP